MAAIGVSAVALVLDQPGYGGLSAQGPEGPLSILGDRGPGGRFGPLSQTKPPRANLARLPAPPELLPPETPPSAFAAQVPDLPGEVAAFSPPPPLVSPLVPLGSFSFPDDGLSPIGLPPVDPNLPGTNTAPPVTETPDPPITVPPPGVDPGQPGNPPPTTLPPGTVPPSPAVPEPATWLMMATGLFGLGAVMRRRRKVARLGAAAA